MRHHDRLYAAASDLRDLLAVPPVDRAVRVVDQLAEQVPTTLHAVDVDRTWQGGPGAPTVTGTAADLAWWLTGRGSGEGLTSDGDLPGIEAW